MQARTVRAPDPSPSVRAEFDDWVRPHLVVMRRVALVTAVGHDPDDIVQDALLRAWQRRETYDANRGTARSWLVAIVADRARRHRLRRRTVQLVELDPATAQPALDRTADLDLHDAVARLPRRQRQAVVLHYFVGLSTGEVADLLGCAVGTVKSNLSDARAALAKHLGDHHA